MSPAMSPELPEMLNVERRGQVAILTLARPEKRNALSDETVLGIERFFDTLDEGVRVMVLDAEGEHLCAVDHVHVINRERLIVNPTFSSWAEHENVQLTMRSGGDGAPHTFERPGVRPDGRPSGCP